MDDFFYDSFQLQNQLVAPAVGISDHFSLAGAL